jgi:flagellar L-ring protein precursor FlgH
MKPPHALAALLVAIPGAGHCEDLYRNSNWPAMSADQKATNVGDLITVMIFEAAESSNLQQNSSKKKTEAGGSIGGFGVDESVGIEFGGGYTGRGEVRRADRLVATLTVTVREVLPNGDFLIGGEQWLRVNGERTRIGLQGRIRRTDISSQNSVLSSRIADAMINYDGRGFVSRSAKPGIVNRIFSFLGLG